LFFFSSRRRHTRFSRDWSSDVCSSDLWDMTLSGELAPHVWFTLRNLLVGLGFGAVGGVAAAWGLYKAPRLAALLEGPLVVFQTRSEERRVGKERRRRGSERRRKEERAS